MSSQFQSNKSENKICTNANESVCSQLTKRSRPNSIYTPRNEIQQPSTLIVPAQMPDTFSGESEFERWLVHFHLTASINGWVGETKAYRCIGGALRARALDVYMALPSENRTDPEVVANE